MGVVVIVVEFVSLMAQDIHLIKNNAMVASQIAVELSKLQGYPKTSTNSSAPPTCIHSIPPPSVHKTPPTSVHQAPPTIGDCGSMQEKQGGGAHYKRPVCAEGWGQFHWFIGLVFPLCCVESVSHLVLAAKPLFGVGDYFCIL